jgi:tetratricopeptide (TPR) repeat protein
LKVRPMQQVLKFRGAQRDLQAAARELGVDTLLVGSMQRDGERVRLSLSLVGAQDGSVRWAQSFDEPWTSILAVEDAIATRVADALTAPLTGTQGGRVTRRETHNVAAYQEYLIGRHFWSQRTGASLKTGLEHFQKAVAIDPRYALAHAGLADSYVGFATFRVLPPADAYPQARAAALKALELDSTLSEAHSALAMVSLYYDWDWTAAELEFQHAIAMNPSDATAHLRYALALPWFGRFDEALHEITRAREADPVSPLINANEGLILYNARRYPQAVDLLRRGIALEPTAFQNHQALGGTYEATGAYEDAIAAYKKAIDLGAGSQVQTDLAHVLAVSGQSAQAKQILSDLAEPSTRTYVSPFDIAVAYVGLGDAEAAFAWLDKAYQDRPRPMLSLRVNPRLDPLRRDPRFTALIHRMKIFDAASAPFDLGPSSQPRVVLR